MILLSLISALILLESREVFQGLFSQPFVTAVLLILAGYDQNFVLAAATVTHLIYLNRVPSGTALFPEYPFGFFVTVSFLAFRELNPAMALLLSVPLIIFFSAITAYFISFKRRLFEKYRDNLMFFKGIPSVLTGTAYSFVIFFIYSLITGALIKLIDLGLKNSGVNSLSIPHTEKIVIFSCLVPAVFYIYRTYGIKK